ncbi:hypothetical protein I8752_27410 [Nostocaceae cyanobacterium CENA369]|uniref:Uncharacterized protein n=1 Tax=Dendronalium phyllosphericum CENA369 TaxID=1725256 RepID=A0A8J7ID48_9NOST|nr:hypothetical protein [Dendronalium phyllosphericum]MBH8576651.1 hypothetical protein [Dendronalium phyllosphericum CENA369]
MSLKVEPQHPASETQLVVLLEYGRERRVESSIIWQCKLYLAFRWRSPADSNDAPKNLKVRKLAETFLPIVVTAEPY